MDIVISNEDHYVTTLKIFFEKNNLPYNKNGDVLSFLYKNFQVDLILTHKDVFKYSCNYFAWNDLGNIIGRMSKSLGFKHGHNGLFYIQRYGDKILKEHLLSNNYLDILKILKLDYGKFHKGFSNLEEIFEFAIASPYFNKEKFKLENLNNINRVRDRKRKTYNQFLEYIKDKPENNYSLSASEKLDFVTNLFPNLKESYTEIENNYLTELKIKSVSNANIIMEVTSLTSGQELGKFISFFKENNPDYTSSKALLKTKEDVILDIQKSYTIWKSL